MKKKILASKLNFRQIKLKCLKFEDFKKVFSIYLPKVYEIIWYVKSLIICKYVKLHIYIKICKIINNTFVNYLSYTLSCF